jgi:excisionase family DNA binding protein
MTKRDNPTRRVLRIKPASEYIGVSPGALRGMIQRGEIPVIKVIDGLRVPWLMDIRDLDEWVERAKVTVQ